MKKGRWLTVTLVALLVILAPVSLFVGVIDLSVGEIFSGNFEQIEIMLISRLPRLAAILCTGAGMGIAGLIMQQLCMNKFVSPSTGATISSAQFGILLAMVFFQNSTLLDKTIMAFVAAILGTWAFVLFIQKVKFKDVIMVPLVGIMFGNIISGITEYISYANGMNQAMTSWLVGDFSLIIRGRYEIVFLVVPLLIVAYIFANHFNIVGMGQDFSKNLGVNYNLVLFSGLTIAALITASVVVIVGSIPYLGLIVPNIISMFKGDKIRGSLLHTSLFGAVFVLICDIIGRLVNYPYEIPISMTVGIVGSILFIGIIFKRLNPGMGRKRLKSTGGAQPAGASVNQSGGGDR